jgi:Protein of unknown function (DUF3455)
MENCMTNHLMTSATMLALTFIFIPQTARAEKVTPPAVPTDIQVPAGNIAFLVGHAVGTQNYICLPGTGPSGFAWTLFGPQATLFDDDWGQITTHFLSANPVEGDALRPTWQHSRDTSSVWGAAMAMAPSAAPNSIPLLLVRVVGAQLGPDGGDKLSKTTFIHRLNTVGGTAPATGCAIPSNVGSRAFVPYTADYFFYRDRRGRHDDD